MKPVTTLLMFVAAAASCAWATPQQPAASPPAPQSQTQPPASTQAPTPAGASQTSPPASQPTAAPPAPVSMDAAQVRALLYKIYAADFRITDLLGTLQPDQWKMDDAARQTFNRTVESIRTGSEALEKPRTELYNHPEDVDSGGAVDAALSALLPDIDVLAETASASQGAAAAAPFTKPRGELADLQQSLESYLAFLTARAGAHPSSVTTAGLETEVVRAPQPAGPPLTRKTVSEGPGYMSPAQVKTLLHGVYMASYRVRDLVSVLHPEQWKLTDAQRASFRADVETLRHRLDGLEHWRGELEQRPASMYFGYQTYAALNALSPRVEAVARDLSGFGPAGLGAQYRDPREKLSALQQSLSNYVGYLLLNQQQITSALEDNLSSCQNTLGYAMRPRVEAAAPMKNVAPIFQGHPPQRRGDTKAAHLAHKKRKTNQKEKPKKS